MRRQGMSGIVFMSYARNDVDRVRPLVDYLWEQGLSVWWDEDIEPGVRFRDAIHDVLEKASCAIVVWTHTSVTRDFVRSEADRAVQRGVLVPVLLDAEAKIPLPFTEFDYLDLSAWNGRGGETVDRLVSRLRTLVGRKTYSSGYGGSLIGNDWALKRSKQATAELTDLVSRIESIGEVLALEAKPAEDVRGALAEVEKTYRVVAKAVGNFVSPALGSGPVAPQPYVEMERGVLSSDIESGRGHCLRILTYYGRAHGLRDWLKPRLAEDKVAELDRVFERLGTADGDLFSQMTEIGQTLTNESRVIVNLLLAGQEDLARKRIIAGRKALEPLEDTLKQAEMRLKQLATSLGFAAQQGDAPDSAPRRT
jgi:hypothetical protein